MTIKNSKQFKPEAGYNLYFKRVGL